MIDSSWLFQWDTLSSAGFSFTVPAGIVLFQLVQEGNTCGLVSADGGFSRSQGVVHVPMSDKVPEKQTSPTVCSKCGRTLFHIVACHFDFCPFASHTLDVFWVSLQQAVSP